MMTEQEVYRDLWHKPGQVRANCALFLDKSSLKELLSKIKTEEASAEEMSDEGNLALYVTPG